MVSNFVFILFILTLGLRHGLDLDHLATIDAIVRKVSYAKRLAKWVGFLFSLGHGLVVVGLSILFGIQFLQSTIPNWLDNLGHWISVFFLLLFGGMNLLSLFSKSYQTRALKTRMAEKIPLNRYSPLFIIIIGGLFALSFDTFTQVSLFSLSATAMAGWVFSGLLGVVFMLGMMLSDGMNGYFTSVLIRKADAQSGLISRWLTYAITFFSLAVAGLEAFQLLAHHLVE